MRVDRSAAGAGRGIGLRGWARAGLLGACMGHGCVGMPPDPPARAEGSSTDPSTTTTTGVEGATSGAEGTATVDEGTSGLEGTTGPALTCGNGVVDEGEECDGIAGDGTTCESLGHHPGALGCTTACTYDTSRCAPPGMVLVAAGEFTMGSDLDDEQPIRVVTLDDFWIDETEVTVAEYTACVEAGVCVAPPMGGTYNYGVAERAEHPVNGVDRLGALTFCGWVDGGTRRLPTEAEWEKAARGTDARTYPWGDVPEPSCTHAVMADEGGIDGCGMAATGAVGSKPLGASPYGALDMAGNAWEWVSDWYGPYDPMATVDPTGPATGELGVLRGGAWGGASPAYFRAADRFGGDPASTNVSLGFRCAGTPSAS